MKKKGLFYGLVLWLFLLLLIINNAAADTNVSGIVCDEVWSLSGSPYIVTGNVLVSSGCTLTIEPGVMVKFDSGKSLQIDGTLIAAGSDSQKIIFTSNNVTPFPGDWGYILFSDSSIDASYDTGGNYISGSILEYVIVEYAGGVSVSHNGAVRMDNAHPFISYTTIRNNSSSGIYAWNLTGTIKITNGNFTNNTATAAGGGIHISGGGATAAILNNVIGDNTSSSNGGGISIADGTTVEIANNTISNNLAVNHNGGAIFIDNFAPGALVGTIFNNIIVNNSSSNGAGIYIRCGNINISCNEISSNAASSNGGGIFIDTYPAGFSSGPASIFNNFININSASSGGGIYIVDTYTYITPVSVSIYKNIISGNNASSFSGGIDVNSSTITISNNALIKNSSLNASALRLPFSTDKEVKTNTITTNLTTGTTPTYTVYVSIYPSYVASHLIFNDNNLFGNTASYELWNNSPQGSANVNAENNWWGTVIESLIQAKIYDWLDDSTKGIVDYSPYSTTIRTDTPISPPAGLTAIAGTDWITLNWNPNSESDVAGYRVYWGTTAGFPYANIVDAGNVTNYTIPDLAAGTYYVTVTAYDTGYNPANDDANTIVNENQTNGNESWYATEQIALISVLGDINNDGLVDISDVILDLRIALGLDSPAPCSNINGDGMVDISDVILTLRMALGLDELRQCT